MFHDPTAIDAERILLSTVVGEFGNHEAIWMWNLGNEPDLFAHPVDSDSGAAWVREMTSVIKELDQIHPVTTGLHTASLFEDNGLRVDHVFAESDVAVMHGYPMYVPWAKNELDPNFVPYLSALVTSLTGKPCLAEEWGGCTSPDTEGPTVWRWNAYGNDRTQYMAGEAEFATYVAETLPRLVEVGSTGAFLWCFADYATGLWDRPPCDPAGSKHERHFGLVRPDGTLKPHGEAIKKFAATDPRVVEPVRTVELDIAPDAYYSNPYHHAQRLYENF
jgi:endo-1,4-beta-mannosidase